MHIKVHLDKLVRRELTSNALSSKAPALTTQNVTQDVEMEAESHEDMKFRSTG